MSTENPNHFDQQKGLVTLPICCKFQNKSYFIHIFACFYNVYIAPGQEQTAPWGQNFYFNITLLSLWLFAVLPLNNFLTVFPHIKA